MKPVLYINQETLKDGNGGDTFWDTEVSWWPEDGFVPLYDTPQKYCPSENNAAYEKGYIEGMSTQIESQVDRAVANLASRDVERYQWLRAEFAAGRETYLAEGIPSGEALDQYIDEQLDKK